MKIELTEKEAQDTITLFDLAVKGGGLQAALMAVPLFEKLQAGVNAPETDELEIT